MKMLDLEESIILSVNQKTETNFFRSENQKSTNLVEVLNEKFSSIIKESSELTQLQINTLSLIKEGFLFVQSNIDPKRLEFSYSLATDNELCLSRKSNNGVSNIIIDIDGSIAYSFISYKHSDRKDILEFYQFSNLDEESLVLKFLTL